MKPNAINHNPDADFLCCLIDQIGLPHKEVAARIGVTPRALQYWMSGEREFSYTVQFALECLLK